MEYEKVFLKSQEPLCTWEIEWQKGWPQFEYHDCYVKLVSLGRPCYSNDQ